MLTQEQTGEILRLTREERLNGLEVAERLGIPSRTVYSILRRHGVPCVRRARKSKLAQYGACDRRDGLSVVIGAAEEVARALGLTTCTVATYAATGRGKYEIVRQEEDG